MRIQIHDKHQNPRAAVVGAAVGNSFVDNVPDRSLAGLSGRSLFRRRIVRIAGLVCLAFFGCEQRPREAERSPAQPIIVLTTCQPVLEMARSAAGESRTRLQIESAVPATVSSRHWAVDREQAARLQTAQRIFLHGAGYEPWKDRVTLARSRVVDTASDYYDRFIRVPDVVTHRHGPEGAHSHPGTVWATWLDPQLALLQFQRIQTELGRLSPDDAQAIQQNSADWQLRLEQLEADVQDLRRLTHDRQIQVLGDGPWYQYLVARLDLPLMYLHWPDTGDTLSELDCNELLAMLNETTVNESTLFLVRTELADAARPLLEGQPIQLVPMDLTELPSDDNRTVLDRWEENIRHLDAAIRNQGQGP
ncbi:MAG: zinc ABC transporter substrate-binding protein [Planctomycetaceae bacterium]|nr:zinc ABC transporter substrate-binding protein [Planctomycetaceae bacterium]